MYIMPRLLYTSCSFLSAFKDSLGLAALPSFRSSVSMSLCCSSVVSIGPNNRQNRLGGNVVGLGAF